VVAQNKSGKKFVRLGKSKTGYFVTKKKNTGNNSSGKTKTWRVAKKKVSLKKGKTYRIKIKNAPKRIKGAKKYKKDKIKRFRYATSDPTIAKVSASGKIKAKRKGKCRIYVIGTNGSWRAIRLTVR